MLKKQWGTPPDRTVIILAFLLIGSLLLSLVNRTKPMPLNVAAPEAVAPAPANTNQPPPQVKVKKRKPSKKQPQGPVSQDYAGGKTLPPVNQ